MKLKIICKQRINQTRNTIYNLRKYKEVFDSEDERLKYINKYLNLRPEGRIVKIIHSVNHEKNQIVTIDFDKSTKLVFATPIDENIPKIFIKMKKINRIEFLKKVESEFNFKKLIVILIKRNTSL